jgi:hypothetical protein
LDFAGNNKQCPLLIELRTALHGRPAPASLSRSCFIKGRFMPIYHCFYVGFDNKVVETDG